MTDMERWATRDKPGLDELRCLISRISIIVESHWDFGAWQPCGIGLWKLDQKPSAGGSARGIRIRVLRTRVCNLIVRTPSDDLDT